MTNPFDPGYYTEHELSTFGFRAVGTNVRIARNCVIIGLENIAVGDNVRIDGFSTLVAAGGYITIGSYIHIGSYALLSGGAGIVLEDFANLSQGVRIYSKSDDYSGEAMTNPMVPAQYLKLQCGEVTIGRHVIIGSGSVVLPQVSIGAGSAVGALSLVNKSLDEWGVYAGTPVRLLKPRARTLLQKEQQLLGR